MRSILGWRFDAVQQDDRHDQAINADNPCHDDRYNIFHHLIGGHHPHATEPDPSLGGAVGRPNVTEYQRGRNAQKTEKKSGGPWGWSTRVGSILAGEINFLGGAPRLNGWRTWVRRGARLVGN